MNEKLYVVGYTVVLTAVFVLLVAGLNALLKERIELNRTVAEQKKILELFAIASPGDLAAMDARAANDLFREKIVAVPPIPADKAARDAEAKVYRYYTLKEGGAVVVAPLAGMGFWDMIRGYVAIDRETMMLQGVAFTQQQETPGLGARIEEDEWRAQFVGMHVGDLDDEGRRVRMVPPDSARPERPEFDAITGATETSRAMERIFNASIARFLDETKPAEDRR